MSISDSYLSYTKNPTESRAIDLFNSFIDYDFSNSESTQNQLFKTWKRLKYKNYNSYKNSYLQSNGSTGPVKSYSFGPNAIFWLNNIEEKIRYPSKKLPYIWINSNFPGYNLSRVKFSKVDDNYFFLYNSYNIKRSVNALEEKIINIEKFHIYSHGNKLFNIFSLNEFQDLFFKYKNKLESVINADCLLFFKNKYNFHINDQMINWKTGVNFYTCCFGSKHILPIFLKTEMGYVNLINLSDLSFKKIDDIIEMDLNNIHRCKCGKMTCNINFIPHLENLPIVNDKPFFDRDLANQLQDSYMNLQFIQNKNTKKITIHKVSRSNIDDEYLKNYWKNLGVSTTIINNSYALVGRSKYPVFWVENSDTKYKKYVFDLKIRLS